MATCKECINYDMCSTHGANCDRGSSCVMFKDKSKYIELPCKFLQKCFVIPTIQNNLSDIAEMKCIGFSLTHYSYNANLITDKNKLFQPHFEQFGKTVFLTREEAEKKLKK